MANKNNSIGEKIRGFRKAAGFTQKELANRLGWSLRRLQSYEQGKRKISALDAILLADALNTTVIDIMKKEES